MKFTVLSENRKSGMCENEEGLSIIFEINDRKILFDTGSSDLFVKNAELLGINLEEVDTYVLSHGHADHSNGLKHVQGHKNLILHPDSFIGRYSLRQQKFVGLNQKEDEMSSKFNIIKTREPYVIFENVYFLGQIPRIIDFEGEGNLSTVLNLETGEKDLTLDDSGIVIKTDEGIIVVSGCAHSGICNTIEYAKQITKDERVLAVIGGFHLRKLNDTTNKTAKYFLDNNVQTLYMGHCNTDEVIQEFEKQLGDKCAIETLYSGASFEIKDRKLKK